MKLVQKQLPAYQKPPFRKLNASTPPVRFGQRDDSEQTPPKKTKYSSSIGSYLMAFTLLCTTVGSGAKALELNHRISEHRRQSQKSDENEAAFQRLSKEFNWWNAQAAVLAGLSFFSPFMYLMFRNQPKRMVENLKE